ncbi:MAG: heavy metal RND transporter [Alphaproteobacteria bacterium]|nr:heavy metal RND transporter [Alphaproteobacteria bacterium]
MHLFSTIRHVAVAFVAAFSLGALSACGPSSPDQSAYIFSTSTPDISMDGAPNVDVRIMRDGVQIADAVIFETRFDMEPEGMEAMTATVTAQGSPDPGTYRFAVKPTMAGRWRLSLGAKIQGEADTVRGSVIVMAR